MRTRQGVKAHVPNNMRPTKRKPVKPVRRVLTTEASGEVPPAVPFVPTALKHTPRKRKPGAGL